MCAQKPIIKSFGIFCAVFIVSFASAQTIKGPQCVVPDTEYQYNITGLTNETKKLCIEGGIFSDGTRCTTNLNSGYVRVKWIVGTEGKFSFSENLASKAFEVKIASPLQPGEIKGAAKIQNIHLEETPVSIFCGAASGGSCNPSYFYQWQQSLNSIDWTDVPGETGENLSFSKSLMQETFYRRKAIERVSGSIAYSNKAVVSITGKKKKNIQ